MKMMHDYEGEEDPEYPREVPKLNLMIEWRTQIRWQPADVRGEKKVEAKDKGEEIN